jgi:hypothetical protein
MKLVVVAALVAVIALLGSRISFVRIKLPLGLANLHLTGTEYVLVGLLLGGTFLDLLDAPTLEALFPILGLGLSWIGMLFGVQFEIRRLTHIPATVYIITLLQATVTMAAVAVPFYFLFSTLFGYQQEFVIIGALSLAAAASDTGQSGIALLARRSPSRARPTLRLLQNIAHMDGLVGVIAFGLISCLGTLHGGSSAYWWIGVSLGLGLAVGLLMSALTSYRLSSEETLLVVIGGVAFGGGLALYLNLSPLLVNLISGMVIANVGRARARTGIRDVLLGGERSIYILFLVLVGAGWQVGSYQIVVLVLVYLIARTLGKTVGGYMSVRMLLPGSTFPRGLGLGLLSHGGIAVAIVVNLHQIYRSELTDLVISIVLIGMLASELVSPMLTRRVLEEKA